MNEYQPSDADYVSLFMRRLEDPDMRLVTEKPHDWQVHGDYGKAAILACLREGVEAIKKRAAVAPADAPLHLTSE
jgi:hypothetical protein